MMFTPIEIAAVRIADSQRPCWIRSHGAWHSSRVAYVFSPPDRRTYQEYRVIQGPIPKSWVQLTFRWPEW